MLNSITQTIERYYTFFLILILAFAFLTRFWRLEHPPAYFFDEVYHAATAKLMVDNDPRAFEWWHPPPEPNTAIDWLHPPLAKYTQAISMDIFGKNSFGWRFSSAVFGVLVIFITALLGRKLFASKSVGLVAAFLASTDGLLLVQSRIAMNDIHVTFFILLSFLMYLYALDEDQKATSDVPWLPWLKVGIALGLAVGSKWSGFFAIIIVAGSEVWRAIWFRLTHNWEKYKGQKAQEVDIPALLEKCTRWAVTLIIIPLVLYVASYSLMFAQGKDWSHFQELHRQIWAYQTNLKATHSYQSRPLQWWLNDRPVWMYVQYFDNKMVENIYAFGNPVIFWLGVSTTFLTLAWILGGLAELAQKVALETKPQKSRLLIKNTVQGFLPITWLWLCYLGVWLPWQLSPRIMFFYHYTPAVPLLCILMAAWLIKMLSKQSLPEDLRITIVAAIMWLSMTVFFLWFPHWTAMKVSTEFVNAVYFWRPSWK